MAYVKAVASSITNEDTGVLGPGFTTLDGVTLVSGTSRILLTRQTTKSQNGVWIYNGANTQLSRPVGDEQYKTNTSLDNATIVWVTGGTARAGTVWGIDPAKVVTIDTTTFDLTRVSLPPVQCRAATTADINLASTHTTIDGVTLVGNGQAGSDIVLVKDQANPEENGFYWVNTGGGLAGTRCSEPLVPTRRALVSDGDRNAHTRYELVTQGSITPDTTPVQFGPQNLVFSVRDFGAAGDDTTDDTTAINAAIAAANAALGGIVYFPSGIYKVTDALTTLAACVSLGGERRGGADGDRASVIKVYTYTGTLIQIGTSTTNNTPENNGVEDLHIQCEADSSATFRKDISGATNDDPIVITANGHGFLTGDRVIIKDVVGVEAANGEWTITWVDANRFALVGADGTGGAYIGGGTAYGRTRFEKAAGAAIELTGAGYVTIRNCAIVGFPIGVCLDGAIQCTVTDTLVAGTSTGGYADATSLGKAIWIVDGGVRNFVDSDSANTNVVQRVNVGGQERDIDVTGGTGNSINDSYFQTDPAIDGNTAIYAQTKQLSVERIVAENYSGEKSSVIRIGPSNINLEVRGSWLNAREPVQVPPGGTVSGLTLVNNFFTTPDPDLPGIVMWSAVAVSRFVALNNIINNDGGTIANAIGVRGLAFNADSTGDPAGIAINTLAPAAALVDGVIAEYLKPLVRVDDSDGKPYFRHWARTLRTQSMDHAHTDTAGDVGAGVKKFFDTVELGSVGDDWGDLAVLDLPVGDSRAFLTFSMQQTRNDDPTVYGLWTQRSMIRRVGGTVTVEDQVDTIVAPPINTGGFTDPVVLEGAKAWLVWQVADAGPTYVDVTTAFNDVADGDLEPFPNPSALDDYFAIGYTSPFDKLIFDDANGTRGVAGDVAWQYWDGTAWTLLAILVDDTTGFTSALADGKAVTWTMPTDWKPTKVNVPAETEPLYYVRAIVTATYATRPALDQGFIGGKVVVRAHELMGQVSRASIDASYLVTLLG